MAYAALTSLAGVIVQILHHEQRYISLCRKDQMISLHAKVSHLQEFLEYITLRSFLPATDVLETRIRDTTYKMENIIELAILSDTGKESESEVQLPTPNDFSIYFEEFHVLLEETIEMRKNLGNNNAMPVKHTLTTTTLSREAPGSKGTKVGLEKALNQILDQVIGNKFPLQIVPITGMGGIGKTTLARASYEAPQTVRHFDVRLWVTVSQAYNIQEILRGLLPGEEQDDGRLIEYVHKQLTGRRYLIVLDDMWDEKVWDRMRNAFPDDENGSRVILTTRSSGVASYVGSSNFVHEMQFMNEDQSWDLLQENVYGHECCSPEFEDMGRMIAANCKGLPLAVVVIAGLLKFNKTRDYWKLVARNTVQKVTTSNDHLFEILCWSYTKLPPHLKACFLYMKFYKEDYGIPAEELVRLWAAEGFLKPKQSRSIEEVAEECLEELAERSLVLVTTRRYNGKIRTCSVHDVVREVSIRKAEEEKFQYHFRWPNDESTFRYALAVTSHHIDNFPHSLIGQFVIGSRCLSFIQCFKLLRVLNKTRIEGVSELSTVCTLTNLRYLHFVCEDLREILVPESISELQNLETLIVRPPYSGSVVFPLEIWKLQRLRHIIVTYVYGLGVLRVPVPNQNCPSLQTLYRVSSINFTKSWVERIPNLKKMKLEYKNDGQEEYSMENLQYLHQLQELSIRCYFSYPYNFVFPRNLKKLSLYKTGIPVENMSSIGLLPNLKVLKLKPHSVEGEEWEPNEGEFVELEHLEMENLRIRHWRAESVHFPCLRKLGILDCAWLREVPESIGEIDTLEKLIVKRVSDEAIISVQKIKEIQQDMGNHLLQVIFLDDYRPRSSAQPCF